MGAESTVKDDKLITMPYKIETKWNLKPILIANKLPSPFSHPDSIGEKYLYTKNGLIHIPKIKYLGLMDDFLVDEGEKVGLVNNYIHLKDNYIPDFDAPVPTTIYI
jgi:hypothetical protein